MYTLDGLKKLRAEWIAMGRVQATPESDRRHQALNAYYTGLICGRTGRELSPDESVIRTKIAGKTTIIGIDAANSSEKRWHTRAETCRVCNRQVFIISDKIKRQSIFCCKNHELIFAATLSRVKRDLKRGDATCKHCGQQFKPKRTDSAYCSSPCRQAAYRKRVTDNNSKLREEDVIRNVTNTVSVV